MCVPLGHGLQACYLACLHDLGPLYTTKLMTLEQVQHDIAELVWRAHTTTFVKGRGFGLGLGVGERVGVNDSRSAEELVMDNRRALQWAIVPQMRWPNRHYTPV